MIHILTQFKEGPWGGGNQFLKNLREQWRREGHYAKTPEEARYILYNSYQCLEEALRLKRVYPEKIFIHRLGPVFHYHRGDKWRKIDRLVLQVAERLADLVVFQSQWSYQESQELGFKAKNWRVIGNAVNPAIFNREEKTAFNLQKIKLISTSWSTNPHKGFNWLEYLDQVLDFASYQMTFIGNSPVKFKNIRQLYPLNSAALAQELKSHDIYIAPFKNEAGSNAILEALACSLPVVALASGGNPEQIKQSGELFQNQADLITKINKVAQNYSSYRQQIFLTSLPEVAQQYWQAISAIAAPKPPPPFWFPLYLKLSLHF